MAGGKSWQIGDLNHGTLRCGPLQDGDCTAAWLDECQAQTRSKHWLHYAGLQDDGSVDDGHLQPNVQGWNGEALRHAGLHRMEPAKDLGYTVMPLPAGDACCQTAPP